MGWNFVQSGIYSGSVSGAFEQPGLFKATLEGPEFLTGGSFGMEGSVVAFSLCTAMAWWCSTRRPGAAISSI